MTAKELRDKFKKDLENLQETCPHDSWEQLEYSFAPGHFTGHMVNVCIKCEKIIG